MTVAWPWLDECPRKNADPKHECGVECLPDDYEERWKEAKRQLFDFIEIVPGVRFGTPKEKS